MGKLVAFRDWSFGTGFFRSESRSTLYNTFLYVDSERYAVFRDQLRIYSILYKECVERAILFILYIAIYCGHCGHCGQLRKDFGRVTTRTLQESLPQRLRPFRSFICFCEWLYTSEIVYPLYSQHSSTLGLNKAEQAKRKQSRCGYLHITAI